MRVSRARKRIHACGEPLPACCQPHPRVLNLRSNPAHPSLSRCTTHSPNVSTVRGRAVGCASLATCAHQRPCLLHATPLLRPQTHCLAAQQLPRHLPSIGLPASLPSTAAVAKSLAVAVQPWWKHDLCLALDDAKSAWGRLARAAHCLWRGAGCAQAGGPAACACSCAPAALHDGIGMPPSPPHNRPPAQQLTSACPAPSSTRHGQALRSPGTAAGPSTGCVCHSGEHGLGVPCPRWCHQQQVHPTPPPLRPSPAPASRLAQVASNGAIAHC